jgi:dynein heavy chain
MLLCTTGDGNQQPDAQQQPQEGGDGSAAQAEPVQDKVTLLTFRKLMQMLAEQRSRMEALPNSRDVSIIRVNCRKLKVWDRVCCSIV